MRNRMKRVYSDTRKVVSSRWEPASLQFPSWAVSAVVYITLARSLAYGLELFILVNSPTTPLMAFAAIMGLQTWGILMLVAVAITLIGMIARNSIVVTVGMLFSAAIWTAFGLSFVFGWASLGYGLKNAVAALATAATWVIFFAIQLKAISINGVN